MREPMFRRIATDLSRKIESGEFAKGSPLPTEIELRESYDASRNQVRDAIKWLSYNGVVISVQGQGLFVTDAPIKALHESEQVRPITGGYAPFDDTSYPFYRRIADDLRKKVEFGKLADGTHLYLEVLREHYAASQQTIRDALNWLAVHGFARKPGRPGKAWSVRLPDDFCDSNGSPNIDELALERIESRLDFGCALSVIIRNSNSGLHKISWELDIPVGNLDEYVAGRQLPPTPDILRTILAACHVNDDQEIQAWLQALVRVRALMLEKAEHVTSQGDESLNLLFRVYVPSDRLYAAEASKLFALFRDWLTKVRGHAIRHDGYRTKAGEVYEFFAEPSLVQSDLRGEFGRFSSFLTLCSQDPGAAVKALVQFGVEPRSASDLAARFSKEVRRLEIDLKHERERRELSIRQTLEEELVDSGIDVGEFPTNQIKMMLDTLIPNPTPLAPMAPLLSSQHAEPPRPIILNTDPHYIQAVESAIAQSVEGSINLGTEAKNILALIDRFGGQQASELNSALHELEDPDVRPTDRMASMGRLRRFLRTLGGMVEDVSLHALQKYLETKLDATKLRL